MNIHTIRARPDLRSYCVKNSRRGAVVRKVEIKGYIIFDETELNHGNDIIGEIDHELFNVEGIVEWHLEEVSNEEVRNEEVSSEEVKCSHEDDDWLRIRPNMCYSDFHISFFDIKPVTLLEKSIDIKKKKKTSDEIFQEVRIKRWGHLFDLEQKVLRMENEK